MSNDSITENQTPCFNCGAGVDRRSRGRAGKYCSSTCRIEKQRELREEKKPPIDPINKVCGRCEQSKLRSEYSNDSKRRDGKYSYCKECVREYHGQQRRVAAEHSKNEYNRLRYHRIKRELGSELVTNTMRSNHLRAKYGLTPEAYQAMFDAQGGRCGICQVHHSETTDIGRGGKRVHFAVDHDHSCCPGKISCGKCLRSLLCRSCNTGIGLFKDDAELLARAVEYLGQHARIERSAA